MKIAGIIAEYNPFHNGHKLQLEFTKSKATHTVCIMSGSFVQRGDMAVCDKWERAQMALQNGADLVVQLPICYSLGAASTFARGGVDILKRLNADIISFGSECGDINALKQTALIVQMVDKTELNNQLKQGMSYPTALCNAVGKSEHSNLLMSPNNLLGIEYLNAIKGSGIEAITLARTGAEHDSMKAGKIIASATLLRKKLYDGESIERYIPSCISPILPNRDMLESMLMYRLKMMYSDDFLSLPDVIEGLENRLYRAAQTATSFTEFLESAKTKRYTMARLRRIAYCALLDITAKLQALPVQYVQVLAANQGGIEILGNVSKEGIPVETKFKHLSDKALLGLDRDILATDLFSLTIGQSSGRDFTVSPKILL